MWKNALHYTNIFGLLWMLVISLFHVTMPRWLLFGGLYVFGVTFLVEIFAEKRWHSVRPDKEWLHYGLLILFFCWGFLYYPWDGSVYFHHHTEQRLPLLAMGVIGLIGLNNRYSRAMLVNTMVITSVCSVLFLIFKAGWHNVLFSPDRILLVSENRIRFVSSHMVFNFFLNSTLIGMWYLLFHADRKPAVWQTIVYSLSAVLIFGALLLSEGRSGFFMGLALVGTMAVIEVCRWNKWAGTAMSVFAIAVVVILCALHPRISSETLSGDLRYAYWKSAFELIEEKPLFGYGISHAQEEFDKVNMKYVDEGNRYYWTVLNHHYIDCHNQFIQSTLEFGVVGLLLILAIYLSPLYICWGKREWRLAVFFTLISIGQSLFDMFLTGQFNILYGILFLMTIKIKDDYSSPTQSAPSSASRSSESILLSV